MYAMPKPRYNRDSNETKHSVWDEECCKEMEKKYGWNLKRVEFDEISPDWVFEGYCDFPPSGMDLSQGEYNDEDED
jgi:hypothetical protein